jgi:hypothetical protein
VEVVVVDRGDEEVCNAAAVVSWEKSTIAVEGSTSELL